MKVEVLYIADCPNYKQAADSAREVLWTMGLPPIVDEVEVRTAADAETLRFIGSPTVRVNGLDVEPESRSVQQFSFGCRVYAEGGRSSGLPSRALIRLALQEMQPTAQPSDSISSLSDTLRFLKRKQKTQV